MFSKLAVFAILSTLVAASPAAEPVATHVPDIANPVPENNFAASCNTIGFSGTTLSANCRDVGGNFRGTSINLNSCITNNGGTLACQVNGGYSGSCSSCAFGGTTLTCGKCGARNGGSDGSSINVNNCVSNNDGQLTCP